MTKNDCLLAYGSLMCDEVMSEVSGACFLSEPALLKGYQRLAIKEQAYPAVIVANDHQVDGVLYKGLTAEAWQRLDCFEGEQYQRQAVEVKLVDGAMQQAQCYIMKPQYHHQLESHGWDYEYFLAHGKKAFQQAYKGYGDLREQPCSAG